MKEVKIKLTVIENGQVNYSITKRLPLKKIDPMSIMEVLEDLINTPIPGPGTKKSRKKPLD